METDVMGTHRNIPLRTNQCLDRDGCAKSTHEGPRSVKIFINPLVVPIGYVLEFVAGFNMDNLYSHKGVLEGIVMP